MKSGRAVLAAVAGAFVLTGGAVSQAAPKYEIDPDHSSVIFKVKNRDIVFVYGRFNTISGSIVTDTLRRPFKLEITAEVLAKSIDTNVRKRDRQLKGSEFLKVSKNPSITFKTKDSKKMDDGRFELVGELTLLGVAKEITVIFEPTGTGYRHPSSQLRREEHQLRERPHLDHVVPQYGSPGRWNAHPDHGLGPGHNRTRFLGFAPVQPFPPHHRTAAWRLRGLRQR